MHFDKIRMRAPKATLEAGYLNPFSFCFRFSEKKISLACEFRGGWASGRKNHRKSRAMQTRGSACHKDGSFESILRETQALRAHPLTATNARPAKLAGLFLSLFCPRFCLLSSSSASRAAHRLFFKSFFFKEGLLCFCKHKLIAAIPAYQHLILHLLFLHHRFAPLSLFFLIAEHGHIRALHKPNISAARNADAMRRKLDLKIADIALLGIGDAQMVFALPPCA